MSDDFVTVEGRVSPIREGSIGFARPLEPVKWIPRSLLHHEDHARVSGMMDGEIARLRIRKWKADELGLTGEPDAHTEDLFKDGEPDF